MTGALIAVFWVAVAVIGALSGYAFIQGFGGRP